MKHVLIIGCGYTGQRLAGRLLEQGHRVTGTVRSEERAAALTDAGVDTVTGGLDRLESMNPDAVFYFVPPQHDGPDPLAAAIESLGNASLEAFVYASSTAVYGDRRGDWVDEDTPISAGDLADARRLAAEQLVLEAASARGLPARICRISGIYGPGRTLQGILRSGHYTLIDGDESWVCRIHVDDLVSGVMAAWTAGRPGRVYNMVDRRPHRASEFANLAADLQGLPRPATISFDTARERYSEAEFRRKVASKRVRCARLVDELGVELRYPSFEQGLPASVSADQERK